MRFDFTGNWALFRLLLARAISISADALGLLDAAPTVLAFQIRVQPDPGKPPLAEAGPGSPSRCISGSASSLAARRKP